MYRKVIRASARTTTFLAHSAGRGRRQVHEYPEIPTRAVSPSLAFSVWVDELVMGLLPRMPEVPLSEVPRLRDDVVAALAVFGECGWLENPRSFHPAPPPPDRVDAIPRRLGRASYDRVTFDSGFAPYEGMPGGRRWMHAQRDGRVHAYVLEHSEPGRPWLVNLHGYSSGSPLDLVAFRSLHHHRVLGYNVIHPVLPLHGPRTQRPRRSGQGFLTLDYVQHLHAFGQAVWDIRRCIAWIRQQGASSITLHGISLGAMMTSLVAAVDDGIDRAIVGTPLVDLTKAVDGQLSPEARIAYQQHGLLGDRLRVMHRVLAPLEMDCLVPPEGRFVYAGVADRMTKPGEAYRLWTHWGRPEVCWYAGSHCASSWSREVHRFVDRVLGEPLP
jgi:pimeloyl-ACP methyl ester carboxylesterase